MVLPLRIVGVEVVDSDGSAPQEAASGGAEGGLLGSCHLSRAVDLDVGERHGSGRKVVEADSGWEW